MFPPFFCGYEALKRSEMKANSRGPHYHMTGNKKEYNKEGGKGSKGNNPVSNSRAIPGSGATRGEGAQMIHSDLIKLSQPATIVSVIATVL